jgi:peptidyl-prolyl cis-trans isomerase A (cyclophilin A)
MRGLFSLILVMTTICTLQLLAEKKETIEEMLVQNPIVQVKTTKGTFYIELFPEHAPVTVENFLMYVNDDYYTGTLIHRIVDGFIVQGGGYDEEFKAKPTAKPIRSEAKKGLSNKRGTVAMSLTTDPHSATSQFFVNVADNPDLDYDKRKQYGFTVFGEVKDGMNIVDKMKKSKTRKIDFYSDLYKREIPLYNVPETDIVIQAITVIREATVVKKIDLETY